MAESEEEARFGALESAHDEQREREGGWRTGHDVDEQLDLDDVTAMEALQMPETPAALSTWRLSPHFLAVEFVQHDRLARTPPQHLVYLRSLCVKYLEPLRAKFGVVTVVSGYRSPAYNAAVGGAPQSFHTHRPPRSGAAADVKCARGRPDDWFRFLDALAPGGLGLYASWVHVDNRTGHARW